MINHTCPAFHLIIKPKDLKTNEHLDTQGFKTEKEIFEYLRKLERGKI